MCLAFPGKIVEIAWPHAKVDYEREKRVARLVERKYRVGDYVIVQGGVVIEKIPRKQAVEWLESVKNAKEPESCV